jgi:hypothetical protein
VAVRFLHGYIQGQWAKLAFLTLLAALLSRCPTTIAWAAAMAALMVVVLAPRLLRHGARVPHLSMRLKWIDAVPH